MMPVLSIGKTDIPYRITHSESACRKRIIVTPNDVEVVAPTSSNDTEVQQFVYQKRRWIYEKREVMNEWLSCFESDGYIKLQSGAKILYRGRNVHLRVNRVDCDSITINYKNGFFIEVPNRIKENDLEAIIGTALTFWLKDRVKEDIRQMAKISCNALGLNYKGIRINAQKSMWGSCTKNGIIKINWHLIAAPKAVLEYVVLHEICHLKHRNHSQDFWNLLAEQMPEYRSAAKWLSTHFPQYRL